MRIMEDRPRTRSGIARVTVLIAALFAYVGGGYAVPALAADAPANDTWQGAVPLTLGDTVTLDTTSATTDAVDAEANGYCGAPFTNASVWYTYTPDQDGLFVADMSESSYTGGFMVFEGTPSSDTLVNCAADSVGVSGTAGTTYYLVAFSDTQTNGGTLVLSLRQGPPSPTIDVSVDPVARVTKDGSARVTGTFTCTNAEDAYVEVYLTQTVGRFKINGGSDSGFGGVCDGQPQPLDVLVTPYDGTFAGGKAVASVWAQAIGQYEDAEYVADQAIRLRGGR